MKVLHLPFAYHPDPVGGTEVYVSGLAAHLRDLGVTSVVAAPASSDKAETYEYAGHRVYRYPVPAPKTLRAVYGEGSPTAAAAVNRVIDAENPDVVHMHALTHAVSALVAERVNARGLPLVFTYHTPTVSCQRGTLLRYGRIPCDGKVLITRCSACLAQRHGAGWASWAFALVPPPIGTLIGETGAPGRVVHALRLTELMALRKRAVGTLFRNATVVVAVSDWVRDLLVRNGVAPEKIVLSRQGTESRGEIPRASPARPQSPIRAIMLGRIDPTKGLGLLLEALALVPTLDCEVDVYGIHQDERDPETQRLLALARRDHRVRMLPPFPSDTAVQVIARYDLTLVPSQWLETGPLVILESFAAGVPVVGSRLGGISERVRHGVDGLLVDYQDPSAWAATLTELVNDRRRLAQLAEGIRPPRTMRQVAVEMRDLYTRIAGTPRPREPVPAERA